MRPEFTLYVDLSGEVRPVTRESFLTAYVDAHHYRECRFAAGMWDMLHYRELVEDEIDEDPPGTERGYAVCP